MAVSEQDRQQAVEAFEKVATPEQSARVAAVGEQVHTVVEQAQLIEVRTQADAEFAVEFLSRIAAAKKRAEEARKFLVGPLNGHVKAINARVKAEVAPLEEADGVVRERVLAFRRKQDGIRAEVQARLDAERAERERLAEERRRREEAEARAAREAAAREAARAEEDARQAERRRREELDREAGALAREIVEQDDETLRAIASAAGLVGRGETKRRCAVAELDRRRQAREAQERAAAARQREEDARAAEQAARDRPLPEAPRAVVAPAAPLRSASGRAAERKVWRGTVVDEKLVPREYLKVDSAAINAAVRAGSRRIPGVLIEQVDELAVRAS